MAEENRPYIGGQAVIEGVMMRGSTCMSIAVRKPNGSLAITEGPLTSRLATSPVWKLPGLRGVATLFESMGLGYRALHFSAEQQMTEEELKESRESKAGSNAAFISIIVALLIFKGIPQLLTSALGWLNIAHLTMQDPRFHLLTGGFQLCVLVIYLGFISRIPEVRRVFQYHGAEHKTISAYEAELPLTVENVRKQTTLHPRCGTTFLVIVIPITILVGALVTPLVLPNAHGFFGGVQTLLLRILLLPVIAGVSFEVQRFTARYCTTGPLRALLWPGFLFQKITTREPDDSQLEVAIASMQTAMWREKMGATHARSDEPLTFPSFAAFTETLPNLRAAE